MTIIGTVEHAKAALDFHSTNRNETDEWVWRGGGSIRTALLHKPTDVIYKVEHSSTASGWRSGYSNAVEAQNVALLQSLCYEDQWMMTGVRIPLVELFRVRDRDVLAMQHIHGVTAGEYGESNIHPLYWEEVYSIGLGDMHEDNYMVDEHGILWPVDFGSSYVPQFR